MIYKQFASAIYHRDQKVTYTKYYKSTQQVFYKELQVEVSLRLDPFILQ